MREFCVFCGSRCARLVGFVFFFQAEDGIRDYKVTGVQTCALPICTRGAARFAPRARGRKEGSASSAAPPTEIPPAARTTASGRNQSLDLTASRLGEDAATRATGARRHSARLPDRGGSRSGTNRTLRARNRSLDRAG